MGFSLCSFSVRFGEIYVVSVCNSLSGFLIKLRPEGPREELGRIRIVNSEYNFSASIVRDEGLGIAEENQERIFHRFERAVSGNEVSGLGLGLYIVSQILEAHKGSIKVKSKLGQGATFIVELPLDVTHV